MKNAFFTNCSHQIKLNDKSSSLVKLTRKVQEVVTCVLTTPTPQDTNRFVHRIFQQFEHGQKIITFAIRRSDHEVLKLIILNSSGYNHVSCTYLQRLVDYITNHIDQAQALKVCEPRICTLKPTLVTSFI